MGRNAERGQMMLELLVLVFAFMGFFLIAIGMTESGETAERRYHFGQTHSSEFQDGALKRGPHRKARR